MDTLDENNKCDLVSENKEFNQEVIRKALVNLLIVDELPCSFVEREGFREFCKVVNPHFIVPSRATVTRDCYGCIEKRRQLEQPAISIDEIVESV
ncbi:putative Zinc finger BED domain-containing protein [Helianthus anomalus]